MNDLRTLPYSLSYKTFKIKGVSDGRLKDGRLKTHINFTSSYMIQELRSHMLLGTAKRKKYTRKDKTHMNR